MFSTMPSDAIVLCTISPPDSGGLCATRIYTQAGPWLLAALFRTTTYADACYYFATMLPRTVAHQCVSHPLLFSPLER